MSRNDACPLVMLSNVSMTTGTASPAVLVLSNVSMTTGTLTYLQLKETYAVVAKICTRVGCGPCSPSILITPLDFPGTFDLLALCGIVKDKFTNRYSLIY